MKQLKEKYPEVLQNVAISEDNDRNRHTDKASRIITVNSHHQVSNGCHSGSSTWLAGK